MLKFLKKALYYGTLVVPFYRFLKDVVVNGYAIYINHQQEIETAKMNAHFIADQLDDLSIDEFNKLKEQILKRSK